MKDGMTMSNVGASLGVHTAGVKDTVRAPDMHDLPHAGLSPGVLSPPCSSSMTVPCSASHPGSHLRFFPLSHLPYPIRHQVLLMLFINHPSSLAPPPNPSVTVFIQVLINSYCVCFEMGEGSMLTCWWKKVSREEEIENISERRKLAKPYLQRRENDGTLNPEGKVNVGQEKKNLITTDTDSHKAEFIQLFKVNIIFSKISKY